MPSPIESMREQFRVPDGIYLLNHSVGCQPHRTTAALENYQRLWAEKGGEAWGDWLTLVDDFRQALAGLLGTRPEAICPQTNISSALTKILAALPSRKSRTKILLSELDFPSMGFVCDQFRVAGYEPVFLPGEQGRLPLAQWAEALRDDVQIVLITHVLSESNYRCPVADICRLARERDIFSVVDVAQSIGVVPIDMGEWPADFVIGSCVKWLCGGPGAGFLWVDLTRIGEFKPIDVGWFSHQNPFEFDIRHFEYSADARRFWGGTPSVLPYVTAAAGIAELSQIGLAAISTHNRRLTDHLTQSALACGLTVNSPHQADERGGSVVIEFSDRSKAAAIFREAGIRVDQRPKFGFRFSPHIYNSLAEIEQVCEQLGRFKNCHYANMHSKQRHVSGT